MKNEVVGGSRQPIVRYKAVLCFVIFIAIVFNFLMSRFNQNNGLISYTDDIPLIQVTPEIFYYDKYEQRVYCDSPNLTNFGLWFGRYNSEISNNLYVTLYDDNGNEVKTWHEYTKTLPCDNYVFFELDEPIKDSQGKFYTICVTSDTAIGCGVVLYYSSEETGLMNNGVDVGGGLCYKLGFVQEDVFINTFSLVSILILAFVAITVLLVKDIKWFKRFVIVMPPIALLFYMFFVHAPIEFFIINVLELDFVLIDFVPMMISVAITITLLLSTGLSFIKYKFGKWIIALVFALDLCMYIQINFMNKALGLMLGYDVEIDIGQIIINALIWLGIFVVCLFFTWKYSKYTKKAITYLCIALFVMQLSSIVVALIQSPSKVFHADTQRYILRGDEQYVVSSQDNVIVFVLDTYSSTYFDIVTEEYPEVVDLLHDFTYYNNADSKYMTTTYSLNYLLSGYEWESDVTKDKFFYNAWTSDSCNEFYSDLENQNYVFNFYSDVGGYTVIEDSEIITSKINNLEYGYYGERAYIVDSQELLDLLIHSSAFRFAPLMLKQQFLFSVGDFSPVSDNVGSNQQSIVPIATLNHEFYQGLLENGLSVDDSHNYYIIHHTDGIHPPYRINENCEHDENANVLQTARGCFVYIEEYINQMISLGVYDNSTIIILADHGIHGDPNNAQTIFVIKRPNEHHDSMEVNSSPISYEDYQPTILDCIGVDYSNIGTSIYDHYPDELRERTLYFPGYILDYPPVPLYGSQNVNGMYNGFRIITYTGDRDTLRAMNTIQTGTIPWVDSLD
ncbi:MAG: hypothetical protein MJ094_04395 [Saccharofermentans sp.]|nr:hypothetical protein [Saccharofermentans sp.]